MISTRKLKLTALVLVAALAGLLLVVDRAARPSSRPAIVQPQVPATAPPSPSRAPLAAEVPGDPADPRLAPLPLAPTSDAEPAQNLASEVAADEPGDEPLPTIEVEDLELDPGAYNEPTTEELADAGLQSSQDEPLPAEVDEPETAIDDFEPEPAQGPVISASGPPLPSDDLVSRQRPTASMPTEVYQGPCASANVPGVPVRWMDMPADARATFPLPHAAAVAYASDRAQRFMVIDDAVFRENDVLPNGLQLIHIDRSSVVLASSGCAVDIPLRLLQR